MTVIAKTTTSGKRKAGRQLFLWSLPFLALVIVFNYLPLFGWYFGFITYTPDISKSVFANMLDSPFAGTKYIEAAYFYKKDILNSLLNTFAISTLGLLFSPIPLFFAILLSETRGKRFKKLVQTVSTLPNFISWVVVFGLMWGIFSIDGALNFILTKLNLISEPTNLLGNERATWLFQSLLTVWKSMGYSAIIYLAAISGIDQELYEAARVDGAGRLASIWHITLPGVTETFFVLLLLNIGNLLNNGLDQYLSFYNPVVANKIEVLDYFVYRVGFAVNDLSFSVLVGMLKSVVSIILLFSANYAAKKIRGHSMF
jgi:putative aldouronate transport system permease protein